MLDMGFMPDVRRIVARVPRERQTLLCSATMPEDVRKLAERILRDPVRICIKAAKSTTELIQQSVYNVPRHQKAQLLAHLLKKWPVSRAIVFTRTKHGADRVVRQLGRENLRAEAIHGNKSQAARQRTLDNFKSCRTHILVATDIAARGIDVEGISHVLNYDLPEQPETYVHRIGRTGRAGASGIAVSFCDAEQRKHLRAIEQLIRQSLTVERDDPDSSPTTQIGRSKNRPAARRHDTGSKRPRRPATRRRRSYASSR